MKPWLFLDFDNTLMATEKLALPSLISRFNKLYGSNIDHKLTLEEFRKYFHGQARENLCKSLSEHFNIEVDYNTLYMNREWYIMKMYQSTGVEMAAYLLESLEEIQTLDVNLAFVSNNPIQRALAAMRYAKNNKGHELVSKFGPNFFESNEKQKPLPDVYLHAMEQLNTNPQNTLAVEDSVTGIQSAIAAGITVFGYTGLQKNNEKNSNKLISHGAVEIFSNWIDFPSMLKKYI